MEKDNLKTEDQKIYPGAADDRTGKVTSQDIRDANCELNNNPRNSDMAMP